MSDKKPIQAKDSSFWTSMPGILTGLAALITAAIGAYAVFHHPAPTVAFYANPASTNKGQPSTLTWQTTNATAVQIQEIGPVSTNGSQSVAPDHSTTFHIIATGPGGTQQATTQITVTGSNAHDPELVELVSEFDNRTADIQAIQAQLAKPNVTHEQSVSLSVSVWRVWFGDPAYQPTLPQFDRIRWVGLVSRIRAHGISQGADKAEEAIHAIENGDPDNVYDPGFLESQILILRQYSQSVLHPAIGQS